MKFLYADAQDFIDPGFDFLADACHPNRQIGQTDQYAHEYFGEWGQKPYDGLLVSYEIVCGKGKKYTDAQAQRFRALGAAEYLRFKPHHEKRPLFADCGAFSYISEPEPPYSSDMIADFYQDCGFTHGISIDHIILGFSPNDYLSPTKDEQHRFDITLRKAKEFLKVCKAKNYTFTPIGAVQGWNPRSMGEAAHSLVKMGYEYLAIGGLVPLKVDQIHKCVQAVRNAAPKAKLHLLGFTKAEHIHEFFDYDISTFDSTAPLIRAFKDNRSNYWHANGHYTAIRIPQVNDNPLLKRRILAGEIQQEQATEDEAWALKQMRALAGLKSGPTEEEVAIALEDILGYNAYLDKTFSQAAVENYGDQTTLFGRAQPWQLTWNTARTEQYRRTLTDQPWCECKCRVCQEAGPEVLIFRGSNRNKRRGFHNLQWFYQHLQEQLRKYKRAQRSRI